MLRFDNSVNVPRCETCKHFMPASHEHIEEAKCQRSRIVLFHPVSSTLDEPVYQTCYDERKEGWISSYFSGQCGISGRYWEPKDE